MSYKISTINPNVLEGDAVLSPTALPVPPPQKSSDKSRLTNQDKESLFDNLSCFLALCLIAVHLLFKLFYQ